MMYSGEADLGECLYTAFRIEDGDMENWYREWYATAEHFREEGENSLAGEFDVSAFKSYYRAAKGLCPFGNPEFGNPVPRVQGV